MATHRDCPRKRYYNYDLRRRARRRSHALAFGTIWHCLLELYWRRRQAGDSPEARFAAVLTSFAVLTAELDRYDQAKILAMLAGYTAIWDTVECTVLAVECEFRLPLLHPVTNVRTTAFDLGGKIDAVLRLSDGRVAIVEHKSSGEGALIGSNYRAKLTLDGQVSQYWQGARALGYEPDVVIYDVAVKPKHEPKLATPESERKYTKEVPAVPDKVLKNGTVKPGKPAVPSRLHANQRLEDEPVSEYEARVVAAITEEPGQYFQRVELVRLARQEDDYRFNVWALARSIRDSQRTDPRYIYQNTSACFKYGRCEYLPVCEHMTSIDDEELYRTATREHEELNSPMEPENEL